MSLMDEVFAAVPMDQWSGAPLIIDAALVAALSRPFPEACVPAAQSRPRGPSVEERNAMCAEVWPQWREARDKAGRAAVAARYGRSFVAMKTALLRWRREVKEY